MWRKEGMRSFKEVVETIVVGGRCHVISQCLMGGNGNNTKVIKKTSNALKGSVR